MKISTGEYIIRETMISLKRNSWMSFASIGTVAVSLFVLGMFLILVVNMNRMTDSLESQVEISVYVKDQNATVNGDQEFYIANKTDSTKKFSYDVYTDAPEEMTNESVSVNQNAMTQAAGYYLTGFITAGESVEGTLRLNQNQLTSYNLADIVGDYSGYMVFFSIIEEQ